MDSGNAEALLQQLFTALSDMHVVNCVTACVLAMIAYDTCVCIGNEIQYIWKAKWSPVKVLYIYARYYGILYLSFTFLVNTRMGWSNSLYVCRVFGWIQCVGGPMITAPLVDVIFILRLHAIYNRSWKVLTFLIVLLILEVAGEFFLGFWTVIREESVLTVPPGIPWRGCQLYTPPEYLKLTLIAWVPCLLVNTIFFIMTLIKFFQMGRRSANDKLSIFRRESVSPLAIRFVSDGSLFFFVNFLVVVFNMALDFSVESLIAYIGPICVVGLYSLSGSRLILNLRVAATEQKYATSRVSEQGSGTMGGVVFRPGITRGNSSLGTSYDADDSTTGGSFEMQNMDFMDYVPK